LGRTTAASAWRCASCGGTPSTWPASSTPSSRAHPRAVACQFHPEFQSTPAHPAPLFLGLVLAAAGRLEKRLESDGGCLCVGSGFKQVLA